MLVFGAATQWALWQATPISRAITSNGVRSPGQQSRHRSVGRDPTMKVRPTMLWYKLQEPDGSWILRLLQKTIYESIGTSIIRVHTKFVRFVEFFQLFEFLRNIEDEDVSHRQRIAAFSRWQHFRART